MSNPTVGELDTGDVFLLDGRLSAVVGWMDGKRIALCFPCDEPPLSVLVDAGTRVATVPGARVGIVDS